MSEEQLRDETHDRWRETLALLGLPPDTEQQPTPTPRAAEPVSERPAHEPEPAPVSEPEPEEIGSFYEQESEPEIDAGPPEEAAEGPWQPEPLAPEEREARQDQPEDESRSRGRRRGRRGGRGRSFDSAEDAGERRGRNSRRDAAPDQERPRAPAAREVPQTDLEEAEDEEELDLVAEDTAVDTSDEEPDTLSDWNVPSWQELISSLYRPDR